MHTNERPAYVARPAYHPAGPGMPRRRIARQFDVYEIRGGVETHSFRMSNQGERLQNILRRGIPADQARTLFYQMDDN